MINIVMQAHVTELQDVFLMTNHGVAICTLEFNESHLEDLTYDLVNPAFYRLTGLSDVTGKKLSAVIPSLKTDNPEIFEIYERVGLTGKAEIFESYVKILKCWLSITAIRARTGRLIVIFDNITDLKKSEKEMKDRLVSVSAMIDTVHECRKIVNEL